MSFDALAAARQLAAGHAARTPFANLAGPAAPPTIADAYRVQEALVPLWSMVRGPVVGLKIATTTKIMQQLMGIDHPCSGMIYAGTIQQSPATVATRDFMHLMVECELAVRIGADLPGRGTPYTRENVREAVAAAMPAFELIEDRLADYKTTKAASLIADNAWNGGIVIGPEIPLPETFELDQRAGTLNISDGTTHQGRTDDPLGALAWLANLAVARHRPLTEGMVVITGSVIATLPAVPGTHLTFTLDELGAVEMTVV